ncbi:MAG TPA: MerR family transcriptional regulator [Thermoanaerobaculia bacterium]|nr:MerR family transcriptional regulator [Thermoanaerobaculia bacterium]
MPAKPKPQDDAGRRRPGQKYLLISAVAERFEIHPQTLRLYEREGLINPARSRGNTRLYDEETLARLETILTLTRDLGVNLAGVEVILNLREQLESMQLEVDRLLDQVRRDLADREAVVERRHALVRVGQRVPVPARRG